ncbi:hypothetical protein PC129_g12289 [Phytophthora cactorum]|uniref:Uncharacterized protein n=2 Tax=Phytophthora cactorum TaxID=29920 RepID=A0A8T1K6D6_9STRA|nr:hypothetical protein Pcac1_g9956 [Phytophthora cactorum]KAG2834078.1 hypothetical protein PC112_g6239 [Phytophthora cactorum]KAG3103369.1 hypothetical protein PC121_g1004 [Phytophthora cactorum]KAG3155624.1 hypothetical protein PC128_g22057 [Phytophthora cactorum]KAG3216874.1 hypothetical protein PC129_g12289 [Phytophthora cactorum]
MMTGEGSIDARFAVLLSSEEGSDEEKKTDDSAEGQGGPLEALELAVTTLHFETAVPETAAFEAPQQRCATTTDPSGLKEATLGAALSKPGRPWASPNLFRLSWHLQVGVH